MEDEPANKRFSAAGWAGLPTALLSIYVLSIGPSAYLDRKFPRNKISENAFDSFCRPIVWLHENTLLKGPLARYVNWWDRLGRKP